MVKSLNSQLSSLRNELLGSISTTRRSYATVAGQLRSEANQNLSKIRQMPRQERQFLDISRQQAIKQELYLFLLKKREETELGKSSTLSNTRVIDYARVSDKPVEPKGSMILLAGLLLGSIVPFLVYFIRQKSNLKLKTKKDAVFERQRLFFAVYDSIQNNMNGLAIAFSDIQWRRCNALPL